MAWLLILPLERKILLFSLKIFPCLPVWGRIYDICITTLTYKLKASHKKAMVVVAQEYDLVLKALAERYPDHIVELVRGVPVQDVRYIEKEAVATNYAA